MRNKAIEKRVDSLLNQSPKALAAIATQITDDIMATVLNGGTEEDAMEALTEFLTRYVKPLAPQAYIEYRDEYMLLREQYWMNLWLKAEMRLAESRRDHMLAIKAAITCVSVGDQMAAYIGIPTSGDRGSYDVKALSDAATAELETAETTLKDWHKPDIWQLIGYEPPV